MFLWGLVVAQPRGEKATRRDLRRGMKSLFPYKNKYQRTDTGFAKQFACFGKELKLIDFGHRQTVEVLQATYKPQS